MWPQTLDGRKGPIVEPTFTAGSGGKPTFAAVPTNGRNANEAVGENRNGNVSFDESLTSPRLSIQYWLENAVLEIDEQIETAERLSGLTRI